MTHNDYAKLVEQAEAAVASVKDPDLKRIAFQKVLDDLIASGSTPTDAKEHTSKSKPVGKGKPRGSNKAKKVKGGPAAYLQELLEEGFFKKPKTITQAKIELENRGHHIPMTSLSGPLQRLCQQRLLRRQKVKDDGGKKATFSYSDW